MLEFKTELVCKSLEKGGYWELTKDFIVDLGFPGDGDLLVIPKGFRTDLGSIPIFIPRWIADPQVAPRSFTLHDFLYQNQFTTQLVADSLLNEGMIIEGANWFQRFTVYRGLRIGGMFAWKKRAKELSKNSSSFDS